MSNRGASEDLYIRLGNRFYLEKVRFNLELERDFAGKFTSDKFFELAVRVGSETARVVDLIDFFTPYDPTGSGGKFFEGNRIAVL